MSKAESPLQLISSVVDCLTVIIEDEAVDADIREKCEPIRDAAVNVALDMQTERSEVA